MELLTRLDDGLYRIERAIVGWMLALMGIVVFLSVSHRAGLGLLTPQSAPGFFLAVAEADDWPMVGPVLFGVVMSLLAAAALSTRGERITPAPLIGGGLTLLLVGFVQFFPNGLIEAQPLALALLLWLGLMGATLAAHDRRHLALDIGSKIWPPALAPKIAAVGHVLTAFFCVVILYLGWRSLTHHYGLWSDSEGAAGLISAVRWLPKWAATLAIPYGMAVLAFRFLLDAARAWSGLVVDAGDDTLRQLGIDEKGTT